LIGPNGSGKSTLLKAILGLVRAHGTVRFQGEDVLSMKEILRAKSIAYLPQDGHVTWPIAVEDLVMLGRAPHRSGFAPPSEADRTAVESALTAMDLQDFRTRPARELSGGERSRALIARALAQDTPILLADEPTSGLDPAHQIALMETFKRLSKSGRTVVASLHDLSLAAQWCDNLMLLDRGELTATGSPLSVLIPERLAAVYGIEAFFAQSPSGPIVVPVSRLPPAF
jgi:iron complex transport system ATP-binding protein